MKRSLLLIALLCVACDDPTAEAPPDAGADVDGAPWSPPDGDPPPGPAVTLAQMLDVNAQPPALNAFGYVAHAGKVYFGARHPGGGFALYATDGTGAGTVEVATRPTWESAPRGLLSAGGALYFTLGDQVLGAELWVTDGTDAGTHVLGDVNVGVANGFYAMIGASSTGVFWATTTAQGPRLWRTDGTVAGTHQLGELSVQLSLQSASAVVIGDRVYFATADGPSGAELYVYDDAAGTTRLVKDIRPGAEGSGPSTLTPLGTKVVFIANDGTHGDEPWITDGTAAGTTLVADIQPGATGGLNRAAATMVVHQGFVYFPANDGAHGAELWRSNGTAAGTTLVADLNPGAADGSPRPSASLGAKLMFSATDGVHGREAFVTTGTAAGTLLLDVNPGAGSSNPNTFWVVGDRAYFVANDGAHGTELWGTDGTADGTALVLDLLPGTGNGAQASGSIAIGDRMYFTGSSPTVTVAPFASDGTSAGTVALIPSAEAGATAASTPDGFVAAGDKVFFAATDAAHGRELWVRDASGTHLVRDVNPGPLAGINGDPVAFGSSVVFAGVDAAHGSEPWISDGTEAGTRLVKDLAPGTGAGMFVGRKMAAAFDGKLYFFGSDGGPVGQELYVTDGTSAGTTLVADLDPTPSNGGFAPRVLDVYNGMLLFNARDAGGYGVFRYTPSGTAVTRLTPNGLYAEAADVGGGKVVMSLFGAPVSGNGLYVTNGTAAGTTRIDTRRARQLFGLGSTIAYLWNGQLFRNDGTLGSTVWVGDPGPPDSLDTTVDQRPVELGGALYFVGGNSTEGVGLWRSDLTPGGTRLVRALSTGTTYTTGVAPVRLGDYLYFAAGDGATGTELWRSDGTTAGTQLVRDVWAGPRSGAPRNLAVGGDALYLSLDDGVHGAEPWRLTVP